MKPAHRDADFGIPGKVTSISLTLEAGLSYERWAEVGLLLGRINRGVQWWTAAWIAYGEGHYGERFAQALAETGLATQTLLNWAWVHNAIPVSRRREELSWAHHEAVAALEPEDQAHWLGAALAGEQLPSGEVKPWSATHLKQQLRALAPAKKPAKGPEKPQEPTSAEPAPAAVPAEKSQPEPAQGRSVAEAGPVSPAVVPGLPPAGVPPVLVVLTVGVRVEVELYGLCEVVGIFGEKNLSRLAQGDVLVQCRCLSAPVPRTAKKPSKAKSTPPAPVKDWSTAAWGNPEALAHLYNTGTPDNVPAVESLSVKRRELALKALKQFPERAWWTEVFEEYMRSRFLSGKTKPGLGHENFRPDFDWLLANGPKGVENCVRVHDGNYRE